MALIKCYKKTTTATLKNSTQNCMLYSSVLFTFLFCSPSCLYKCLTECNTGIPNTTTASLFAEKQTTVDWQRKQTLCSHKEL